MFTIPNPTFSPSLTVRSSRTAIAMLAVVMAANAAACSRDAGATAAPEAPATPVRVASVEPADAAAVTASGTLGAKDEIPLGFKIGGAVASVTVDAGARVKAGDVLAELDLREIDAGVAKATAGAEKARRDAVRVERLYRDSVATLAQWQDAQTAREVAEADLRAARMNREYAVIKAPTAGVILARQVNPGAQVAAGNQVLVLGSSERGVVFRAGLPDRDVVRVRVGNAATVTFDALPEREFRGRVRQVGADADQRTGTYTIEVVLTDAGSLPNGLVGRVRVDASGNIGARGAAGVSAIPAEALVEGDGTQGLVFLVDSAGTLALRREVTLVGMDGNLVLVRGIDSAARVITSGAAWLKDSTRVEVRP